MYRIISKIVVLLAFASVSTTALSNPLEERCNKQLANFGESLKVKTHFMYNGWGQLNGATGVVTPAIHGYADLSVTSKTRKASLLENNITQCATFANQGSMLFKVYARPQLKDLPPDILNATEFEFQAMVALVGNSGDQRVQVSDADFKNCHHTMDRLYRAYFFEGGPAVKGQIPKSGQFDQKGVIEAITGSMNSYCDNLKSQIVEAIKMQFLP